MRRAKCCSPRKQVASDLDSRHKHRSQERRRCPRRTSRWPRRPESPLRGKPLGLRPTCFAALRVAQDLHHFLGVRHAKLTIACGCKSHPAKAVAGRPGPSLAGAVVTRRLKCRQGLYGVWD